MQVFALAFKHTQSRGRCHCVSFKLVVVHSLWICVKSWVFCGEMQPKCVKCGFWVDYECEQHQINLKLIEACTHHICLHDYVTNIALHGGQWMVIICVARTRCMFSIHIYYCYYFSNNLQNNEFYRKFPFEIWNWPIANVALSNCGGISNECTWINCQFTQININ